MLRGQLSLPPSAPVLVGAIFFRARRGSAERPPCVASPGANAAAGLSGQLSTFRERLSSRQRVLLSIFCGPLPGRHFLVAARGTGGSPPPRESFLLPRCCAGGFPAPNWRPLRPSWRGILAAVLRCLRHGRPVRRTGANGGDNAGQWREYLATKDGGGAILGRENRLRSSAAVKSSPLGGESRPFPAPRRGTGPPDGDL